MSGYLGYLARILSPVVGKTYYTVKKFLRICGFHLLSTPVKPFFWKCYVDDVISAVSGNEAERLLSHLNSVEPSIQFTLEREKDRHLPFLDLNVSRGVQG